MACQETWISEFTNLIVTCILTRVNSDEAVSSTNRFKAFTSKAFYGLLNSLKAAAIKVVELIFEALVYLLNSDEALVFFEAFHGLLLFLTSFPTALNGLHFPVMGVSPLDTHFAIILFFYHGYNHPWHCIYGDKTTTSRH
nr:uncharacterized protein LOC112020176 [Quercus suber]